MLPSAGLVDGAAGVVGTVVATRLSGGGTICDATGAGWAAAGGGRVDEVTAGAGAGADEIEPVTSPEGRVPLGV